MKTYKIQALGRKRPTPYIGSHMNFDSNGFGDKYEGKVIPQKPRKGHQKDRPAQKGFRDDLLK